MVISVMLQLCSKMKMQNLQRWGTMLCNIILQHGRGLTLRSHATCLAHFGGCRNQHACMRLMSRCTFCAVWAGAFLGIGCAIVVGTVFIVLFYVAKKTIFRGAGQAIFSGFLDAHRLLHAHVPGLRHA